MTSPYELPEHRVPAERELASVAPIMADTPIMVDTWMLAGFENGPVETTRNHVMSPASVPASPRPAPYDHGRLAQERSVRGQFLRDVMATTTLSEPDQQLIMRVGLLALDGYDDLEVR